MCTSNFHAQWFQQNSGTDYKLNTVIFFDENTGLALGNNSYLWGISIIRTTNGGTNWVIQYSDTAYALYAASFINQSTGWAVGYHKYFGAGIIKTTNNGINWFSLNNGIGDIYLYSCYFIDQNTGLIVGDNGIIYKTSNGGMNWLIQNNGGSYEELYSIYFIDQNTGWAVGQTMTDIQYYYEILRTINGGTNWTYRSSTGNTNSYKFYKVYFLNNNTGWISYLNHSGSFYYGGLWKSTNGGIDWYANGGGFTIDNYGLYSFFFVDQITGWTVGGSANNNDTGIIMKSTDGGANFYTQKKTPSAYISSIFFINHNIGWAVGENGIILKTTNGGDPIGIKLINGEVPASFKLSQNYPNPFNPSSNIEFELPKESLTSLIVYDVDGREVSVLINENLKAGSYKVNFDGSNLSNGVYFYKLISNEFSETRKMVLLK